MSADNRKEVLQEALHIVSFDRNVDYDEPERNFTRIANLWSAYLEHPITPHDVAVMSLLIKVARIINSPGKQDHWVDIAGYSACGWDAYLETRPKLEASDSEVVS